MYSVMLEDKSKRISQYFNVIFFKVHVLMVLQYDSRAVHVWHKTEGLLALNWC